MPDTRRKAAVIGGNRIPFARANGAYARASNLDMLTATLDGLVARFGLAGERLGEVAGGAVLKHSRDRDLTREAVLGSTLSPYTPAYDVQQACGTGLETAILVANKIALGQIESGIAAGVDTASDAPVALNDDLRRVLMELNGARTLGARLNALRGLRPGQIVPEIPRNAEPRTGLSMGEHAALTALEWQIGREEQDELTVASHRNLAAAYDRGFFDDLVTPFLGLTRDQNLRPDSSVEKLAKLKPVFGKGPTRQRSRHDDGGQLDAAHRRRLRGAARLRRVGRRAPPPGARPRRRRRDRGRRLRARRRRAAHRARLRRAAAAGAQRAHAAGLRLLRDPRGVRVHGARHPEGLGGPGLREGAARARRPARLDRPGQAQRRRLVARHRAPVRGHRRPDRRDAGEAAAREGFRPAG